MRGFCYEVREFFAELFGRRKPRYVGFLRKSLVEDSKQGKGNKCRLGFIK